MTPAQETQHHTNAVASSTAVLFSSAVAAVTPLYLRRILCGDALSYVLDSVALFLACLLCRALWLTTRCEDLDGRGKLLLTSMGLAIAFGTVAIASMMFHVCPS